MKARTRRLLDLADSLGFGVAFVGPGPSDLLACECGHGPDRHVNDAGCLAVVGDAQDSFCPCERYEVAP